MMKKTTNKTISTILSLIFITCVTPCVAFADNAIVNSYIPSTTENGGIDSNSLIGDGTTESPYLIYNGDDLILFRDKVNSGDTDISGKLMDDIVLNRNFNYLKFNIDSYESVTYDGGDVPETFIQWEPIGSSYGDYYNGTFDGNGYTISGLYINNPTADEQALFGCIYQDGTVKNLGIVNSCIIAQNSVCGIVATNYYGNIENCYNAATVAGNDTVSGIVAYGAGNVEDCYNTGEIFGSATTIGGVAGGNYGNIFKCYNSGNVSGSEYVGGIAGMNDMIVENCYSTGAISGDTGIGGVVGMNLVSVKNCYNIGKVSGTTDAGSVAGSSDESSLINCYYLEDNQIVNSLGNMISKEQFASQDIFVNSGWDFTSTWIIDDNLKRPVLQSLSEKIIRIAAAEYIRTSDGYEINALLTQPADNMKILSALYDENGLMIATSCSDADDGVYHSLNIKSDEPGTLLKVFLWNDTDSIYPVCDAKSIVIE